MNDLKIPIPPLPPKTTLNKPINFWSSVLLTLDRKLSTMEEIHGFGEINLTLTVHRGKLTKIMWSDKIFDNDLVELGDGMNKIIKEEVKIALDNKEE